MTDKARSRKGVRADQLLVARGLCESRAKAQALIMAGQVLSAGERVDKAGRALPDDAPLELREQARYVSRGGDKLAGALRALGPHGLVVAGAVCLDVGASTGGFTDCLLQHGAARVYAVDVGYGQLHPKLRQDPRVVVRERENARHLERADFAEPVDLVVVDASFIGIAKLVPAIARVLGGRGALVALVKPQFEVGKREAAKSKGVIRDPALRERAIEDARVAVTAQGFEVVASCDSEVHGPKGNVEHFLYARPPRT